MTFNWGEVKDDIERLYMKEGRSLEEVREILKSTRNFSPSVRAYKDKLEEWGYKKYNARRKVPVPAAASLDVARDLGDEEFAQVASALLPGSDSAIVETKLMQVMDELERQACVARYQRMTFSKGPRKRREQVMELDTDITKGIRNSLEIVTEIEMSISAMTKVTKLAEQHLWCIELRANGTISLDLGLKRETVASERAHVFAAVLTIEVMVGKIGNIIIRMEDVKSTFELLRTKQSTFELLRTKISTFELLRTKTQDCNTDSTTTRTTLPSNSDLVDLCDEPEDGPGRFERVVIGRPSVRMGSAKQSASKSLIKHKRKNKSQPRRANSAQAFDGKLPPWPDKQVMNAPGVPRVSSGLTLSPSIFSFRFSQVQGFPEQSLSLRQPMPTPNHPLKSELMDTWTSTNNHLIDMDPHDQFDSSFCFNNSANAPFLAPASCQLSETPPLMDLPEWSSLNQYPAFGGNGIWQMSPGMNISHNVTEEGLMQTGEDLNVGDMDLLNFIDIEQVDSGINWF